MSWIDDLENNLVIVTGDGKEYKPLWKDPRKTIEFNVSTFEFPGVRGSNADRGEHKGIKYPLEIYFVGEDHIDQCTAFENSAKDKRYWKITHPYYGLFNAQPTVIDIDHTGMNVSALKISLIETIVENNTPKAVRVPSDYIINSGAELCDNFNEVSHVALPALKIAQKNLMQSNIQLIYDSAKDQIKDQTNAEDYFNFFNDANREILNATDDAFQAFVTVQGMINAPFQFVDSVKNRINILKRQFDTISMNLTTLVTTKPSKIIYQHNAGLLITTIAQASVNDIDYVSAAQIIATRDDLLNYYDQYVANLDSLQSDNGGEEDAYIPDVDSMNKLNQLVKYAAAQLYDVALDAKQERSIILEKDSNVIVLTHRLYGLVADDSTINYLIDTNEFAINDLIQIEKGRKVKYYV